MSGLGTARVCGYLKGKSTIRGGLISLSNEESMLIKGKVKRYAKRVSGFLMRLQETLKCVGGFFFWQAVLTFAFFDRLPD